MNGNLLKKCVSEIRVKRIGINQGLGVCCYVSPQNDLRNMKLVNFQIDKSRLIQQTFQTYCTYKLFFKWEYVKLGQNKKFQKIF